MSRVRVRDNRTCKQRVLLQGGLLIAMPGCMQFQLAAAKRVWPTYMQAAFSAPHGLSSFLLSCCPILQGFNSVQPHDLGLVVLSAAICRTPPPQH